MIKLRENLTPNSKDVKLIKEAIIDILPDNEDLLLWYKNYSKNHINRLSFDLRYLLDEFPVPLNIRVLEIGSLPLILTLAMQQKGFNVVGFDVNPNRFKEAIKKNNINIIQGTIGMKKLPFEDNTFDCIIMNEVFEHLNTNLISVLSEIKRVLKNNGKLFISTPNLKSMVGIRNFLIRGKAYSCCGEIYEEYNKINLYGHMGHVREYTPVEVISFLKEFDFKISKLIYRGKYPKIYRLVEFLLPSLKPFFSIVATKI